MHLRYNICLITILLGFVVLISFNPVISSNEGYPNVPLTTDVLNEGTFERFLRQLFDLLSSPSFPARKLKKLCGMLYKETSRVKNDYARTLAKRFRFRFRMHSDEVKEEVQEYRQIYEKKLPARTAFLKAMNDVFTLRENFLFDDYIYYLRDYGTDDKLFMDDETRKVVHDVIMSSVRSMGARDQIDLERKLKKAIKEYDKDSLDLGLLAKIGITIDNSNEKLSIN